MSLTITPHLRPRPLSWRARLYGLALACAAALGLTLFAPAAFAAVGVFPNCTNSASYWQNNPAAWPVNQVTLGQLPMGGGLGVYSAAEAQQILAIPPNNTGDPFTDNLTALAQALITAKLNIAQGADDATIAPSILAADALIGLHGPLAVAPMNALGDAQANADAIALILDLNNYNFGVMGPGVCQYPPVITTPAGALAGGTEGVAYNVQLGASNNPAGWSLTAGALPAGLALGNDGRITGAPAAGSAGDYAFSVKATNADGDSAVVAFTLKISPPGAVNPQAAGNITAVPTLGETALVLLGLGLLGMGGLTLRRRA